MVVKRTLFATLLLGASFNTIFSTRVALYQAPHSIPSYSYKTLHLSTIPNTWDCTSQMPKMCYCGLKSSRRICKYALIMSLLAYIFVKRSVCKKRCDGRTFSSTISLKTAKWFLKYSYPALRLFKTLLCKATARYGNQKAIEMQGDTNCQNVFSSKDITSKTTHPFFKSLYELHETLWSFFLEVRL